MSKGTKGRGGGEGARVVPDYNFTQCAESIKHGQKQSSGELGTSHFADSDIITLSFSTNR